MEERNWKDCKIRLNTKKHKPPSSRRRRRLARLIELVFCDVLTNDNPSTVETSYIPGRTHP